MRFDEHCLYNSSGKIIMKSYRSTVGTGNRGYREHYHTECELSLFLSGRGVYRVGDKEYVFSPGDMFLFGSNEEHCITFVEAPIDLLNIQFEPQILWEQPENVELLSLFFSRNENFRNNFQSTDFTLHEQIIAISRELSEKAPAYEVMSRCSLFFALAHIIRSYNYTNPKKEYTSNDAILEKLSSAIAYIDNNIANALTLSDIAKKAYMSQNYFSSVFKKYNGISPWEYITIKRVEKAISLLNTTSLTKLEIAEKCGFSSSSNFYKAFEKITGKTPSEFVK